MDKNGQKLGKFITLEGGEGVGKSTLQRFLADKLRTLGISVVETREPGGTPSANLIREVFVKHPAEDRLTTLSEFFLASAARAQHVEKLVRPALEKGQWVLCDRFVDSARVYQGFVGKVDSELIERVSAACCQGIVPDCTFILDADPAVAFGRMEKRKKNITDESHYDLMDQSFHQKVREGFLSLAAQNPTRYHVVNAQESQQNVLSAVLLELQKRLIP